MTQIPPYMGDFSDDDIAWLYRNGTIRQVPAGEAIIREGEDPTEVFLILDGEFLVSTESYTLPLHRTLGVAEIAGEMSYLNKRPPGATVRAKVDSVVLCVPRTKLDQKIAEGPGFASRFRKVLLEFAMDRIYGWRDKHGDAHLPPPQDPNANLRVWKLIEKMLNGEFPDSLPPGPDADPPPPKGRGRPPPGGDSGGSNGPPKPRGRPPSGPDPDGPDRPDGPGGSPKRDRNPPPQPGPGGRSAPTPGSDPSSRREERRASKSWATRRSPKREGRPPPKGDDPAEPDDP